MLGSRITSFSRSVWVITLIIGGSLYGYVNSTRDAAITKEFDLNALYVSNMSQLSSSALKVSETLGVADRSANKMNEIFLNAIQGRYGDKLDQEFEGESMFNVLAITEDNPDLTANAESYAKVQDVIIAEREKFKSKQDALTSRVGEYRSWMKKGFVRSSIITTLGFPSDDLVVPRADGTNLYGRTALDWMGKGVQEASAVEAFETGTQKPIIEPEATPTQK